MSNAKRTSNSNRKRTREVQNLQDDGITLPRMELDPNERQVLTRAGRRETNISKLTTTVEESISPETSIQSPTDSESDTNPSSIRPSTRRVQGGVDLEGLELPQAVQLKVPDHSKKKEEQDFILARSALTLATLPENLPCRDYEKRYLDDFLTEFFTSGVGICLYICGVPGTGKTATTMEVMQKHKTLHSSAKFVQLNCLSMVTVSDLYSALWTGIQGQHQSKKSALTELNTHFKNNSIPTVLLLDEMDILITKKASELYNLFEWCQNGSPFCIVGISNTVDLQERLPGRIQSRMGKRTLIFSPYTKQQMISIVKHRLPNSNIFEEMAIQRAAAKVSSVSGDVRRTLQLLQHSIDVYLSGTRTRTKVSAHDVGEAIIEMFGEELLMEWELIDRLILAAVLQSRNASGVIPCYIGATEILQRVCVLAQTAELPAPSDGMLLRSIQQMKETGIVKIEDVQKRLFERLVLELDEKRVVGIICEDSRLEWLRNAFKI